MLTVIVSVCSSATSVRPFQSVPFEICPEFLFADLERLVGLRSLADLYGIVLALRMSFPIVRHEQAPKIRMTVEHNAEHVPDFAFEPASRRPDTLDSRYRRIGGRPDFEAEAEPIGNRQQVVDDFEAGVARKIIGGRHFDEHIEPE